MSGINKIKLANVDYDIVPIKYAIEVVTSNTNYLVLYDCATNQVISTDEQEIKTILDEYVSNYNSKHYPVQIIYYYNNFSNNHVILTYTDGAFVGESSSLNAWYKLNLDDDYDDGHGNIHEITMYHYDAIEGWINPYETIGQVSQRTLFLYNNIQPINLGAYDSESKGLLYPGRGIS